jgi:hypothetical protein
MGDVVPCFAQLMPLDVRLFEPDDDEADRASAWDREVVAELDRLGVDADRATSSSLPDLSAYDVVAVFAPYLLELAVRDRLEGATVVSDPVELASVVPAPVFRCDNDKVDLVRLTGAGREVLCGVNGTPDPLPVTLTFDGSVRLRGCWTPEDVAGDGAVVVHLAPWAVQVWEVTR